MKFRPVIIIQILRSNQVPKVLDSQMNKYRLNIRTHSSRRVLLIMLRYNLIKVAHKRWVHTFLTVSKITAGLSTEKKDLPSKSASYLSSRVKKHFEISAKPCMDLVSWYQSLQFHVFLVCSPIMNSW